MANEADGQLTLRMLWIIEELKGASRWSPVGEIIACNNQSKIIRATTRDRDFYLGR